MPLDHERIDRSTCTAAAAVQRMTATAVAKNWNDMTHFVTVGLFIGRDPPESPIAVTDHPPRGINETLS